MINKLYLVSKGFYFIVFWYDTLPTYNIIHIFYFILF